MAAGWKDIIRKALAWLASPSAAAPTDEGVEFTIPESQCQFTLPYSDCDFVLPSNLSQFTLPEDD